MSFSPDLSAIDAAIGAVVLGVCAAADPPLPLAAESVYFGNADDPRAARPSCRIYRGAIVSKSVTGGRRTSVPQAQVWKLPILAVAEGDYTVGVLGTDYTYPAGAGDDADAIEAGIVGALAVCPDVTAEAVDGEDAVQVTAAELGKHLALTTTPNLGRQVTRDKAKLRTRDLGELTLSFQFATTLDPTSPSGSQHALAYASLLRSALWHPAALSTLRSAGLAPLRVAGGPFPQDEQIEGVTETRANLDLVFSVELGATTAPALIETADPVEGAIPA